MLTICWTYFSELEYTHADFHVLQKDVVQQLFVVLAET